MENETVHHCDINKMKKKRLVPFSGFVEHIIIPNQGIRQVHTSHVLVLVLHCCWNRDSAHFPTAIWIFDTPKDCLTAISLVHG